MELPRPDPSSSFRRQLGDRLLDARTVVLNEAPTSVVAGRITEQIAVLDAESSEPILFVVNNAPGGEGAAGLSIYDFLRSATAPVKALGGGRIVGAGVLAFLGAPSDRRFALPHVRFRLEEPRHAADSGPAADLQRKAEAAQDRRARVVTLLAEATGHSEPKIEEDLSSRRAFDAEAAQAYGLIDRVVERREDVE